MNIRKYKIAYKGSVKNLRIVKKPTNRAPGVYLFEFTDDYSIFDYGKMPDELKDKGSSMAMLTAFIFEKMEDPASWRKLDASGAFQRIGNRQFLDRIFSSRTFKTLKREGMKTHYRGLINDEGKRIKFKDLRKPVNLVEVTAVNIIHPERAQILGQSVWNYLAMRAGTMDHLIPLENVFRFGLPKGSSFFSRMEIIPGYMERVGLKSKPAEGDWLDMPIMEFFSKLEPGDRFLDVEKALNFSGLDNEEFSELSDRVLLSALFLLDLFAGAKIELWDGKFEFLKSRGMILLGDAITPDEFRLMSGAVQISKEPIRQYYKKSDQAFMEDLKLSKEKAKTDARNIRRILKEDFNREPAPMSAEFKSIAEEMYRALFSSITGSSMFEGSMPISEVVEKLRGFAGIFELFLLGIGQLGELDAAAQELGGVGINLIRHQIAFLNRLLQRIVGGGQFFHAVEEPEGVAVDLVHRGGGKTHLQAVEPFKNILVAVIDGAV